MRITKEQRDFLKALENSPQFWDRAPHHVTYNLWAKSFIDKIGKSAYITELGRKALEGKP